MQVLIIQLKVSILEEGHRSHVDADVVECCLFEISSNASQINGVLAIAGERLTCHNRLGLTSFLPLVCRVLKTDPLHFQPLFQNQSEIKTIKKFVWNS